MNRQNTQEVCPFNNERFVPITNERDYRADWRKAEDRPDAPGDLPGTESPALVELMRMTREEWDRWTPRVAHTAPAVRSGAAEPHGRRQPFRQSLDR